MGSVIDEKIDIREEDIAKLNRGSILKELLTDHSKRQFIRTQPGHEADDAFIIWATDDYFKDYKEDAEDKRLGITKGSFQFDSPILPEILITGNRNKLIMPRVLKDKIQQIARSKDKAEVFTPAWVCNVQNNLIDEAWFGRKDVFNKEMSSEDGTHTWEATSGVISFENTGKAWGDYVRDTRLEITCGEAPYLVSRYDTTTGEEIPLRNRIGLLDRKMRVVNENVQSVDEWEKWAKIAYQNTYGFEWQGDNLLLAREALFYTLLDYYEDIHIRLGLKPTKMHSSTMQSFAYIISWNIWQMDGLKFVIPGSCHEYEEVTVTPATLFEEAKETRKICQCPGCVSGDNKIHNGLYAKIRNWGVFDNGHKDKNGLTGKERCDIRFVDIVTNE